MLVCSDLLLGCKNGGALEWVAEKDLHFYS